MIGTSLAPYTHTDKMIEYDQHTISGWAQIQAFKAMTCLDGDTLTTLAQYGAWRMENEWNNHKPGEALADRFADALTTAGNALPLVFHFRYSLTERQANLFEDSLARWVYFMRARAR